jgi:hypothetical protein
MIRKVVVIIILGCLILGTAAPVLAEGSGDGGNNGGGSSSGNGGGSSDSGSSSGNGGGSSDSGSSSGDGSSSVDGGSRGSGSGDQIGTGPGATSEPSEVPTQDQSRDRSQDQSQVTSEPSEVPTQDQSRDQSQSQDQTELNDQYLQQVHDRQAQLLQDQQLSQDQERLNRDLALYSVTIAENVTGINGSQFVQLADQVNQSYSITEQARTRIQERSRITRLFLGGDAAAAQTLLQVTEQNQDRIRLMEQDLQNCDCNQTIRDQLQEQLMTISQDQDRLRTLANQTLQDRGIFGGLFR